MDLFVMRKFNRIKVPLYLTKFSYLLLIVALVLVNVNGIKCNDNYVRTTAQPQLQRPTHQHSGAGSLQSSGSHGVENVHKMLSHAMSETINNEFGSE